MPSTIRVLKLNCNAAWARYRKACRNHRTNSKVIKRARKEVDKAHALYQLAVS